MIAQLDPLYLKTRPTKALSRLISYAMFEGRPLTTRGQWINPLVFAHLRLEAHLPQPKPVRKPIFIVGTGRSGSTILGVVLSMHRHVGFLNEPKAMWQVIEPSGDVFGQYSPRHGRYVLDASDATAAVKRRARRIFGAYLLATGNTRLVDKFPELIFRVPFVKAIFPDARFLFLIRNGWETCSSIQSWSKRNGQSVGTETHDWWGAAKRKWNLMLEQLAPAEPALVDIIEDLAGLSRHTDMAAVEWVVTMNAGLRAMEANPASFRMVRYESLVSNPRAELAQILDFCELDRDETFLSFGEQELRPSASHPPFDLAPAVRPSFENTMRLLGYGT